MYNNLGDDANLEFFRIGDEFVLTSVHGGEGQQLSSGKRGFRSRSCHRHREGEMSFPSFICPACLKITQLPSFQKLYDKCTESHRPRSNARDHKLILREALILKKDAIKVAKYIRKKLVRQARIIAGLRG
jgi:hypothetical protein